MSLAHGEPKWWFSAMLEDLSEYMVGPFSVKLHRIDVCNSTTDWCSFNKIGHTIYSDEPFENSPKSSHNAHARYDFFSIFIGLLWINGMTIFCETPLNWSMPAYNKLVEYQLLDSFLHYLPWPLKMVEKSIFAPFWERSIFCHFQNASPRKWSGHFLRNSTQSKSSIMLPFGGL